MTAYMQTSMDRFAAGHQLDWLLIWWLRTLAFDQGSGSGLGTTMIVTKAAEEIWDGQILMLPWILVD